MLPYVSIGPLLLNLPPLALLLGFWLGSWLATRPAPAPFREEGEGSKVNLAVLGDAIYLALAAGLVGARLFYAARYLGIYLSSPLSLLALDLNTLDVSGGLLAAALAGLIYGRRKGLPLWPALDRLALLLAALLVGVGLSNFLSGEAYGLPSGLPWAVYLWDAYRHPVQLYEAAAALLALGWMYVPLLRLGLQSNSLARRLRQTAGEQGEGVVFLRTVAILAAARLLLEPLRVESAVWGAGIRQAQVIALLVLLAALWGLRKKLSKPHS